MKSSIPKEPLVSFTQVDYTAPFPITRVVRAHDIAILRRTVERSVTGMLVINEARHTLVLNNQFDRIEQRFWLAHLFGHFVLHRQTVQIFVDTPMMRRHDCESEAERLREKQANEFAMELLMPERVLRDRFAANSRWISSSTGVGPVAAQFAVTELLFALRLSQLGLMNP